MRKTKEQKAITLVALIITIVVLLILAVAAIRAVTGEGIIQHAENAKRETIKAGILEKIQLIILGSFNDQGEYDVEIAKKNLEKDLKLVKDAENNGYTEDENGGLEITYNGYGIFYVNKNGRVGYKFNPKELTIGQATNTDKYGWKVNDYTVKTTDCPSGVWRLFYQDSKYTYLINDEPTTSKHKPIDYYDTIKDKEGKLKYQTGADVSVVGQKLSPKISTLFTDENKNDNIRFVAWMTDTDVWSAYKDENEDAVFAIGSPTVELFVASYNSTGKSNTINVGLGEHGYYIESAGNEGISTTEHYGIYNKKTTSSYWLASPGSHFENYGAMLHASGSYIGCYSSVDTSSLRYRPVVCIPTSIFNSDYLDSIVDE